MTISVGDRLPDATLMQMGPEGPEKVELGPILKGRKVVLFGLPGAFTGTCSTAHLPSFMRTRAAFGEKGVDDVICVCVNDPFVVGAWSDATGAGEAGVTILGDPAGDFTRAIGMEFSADVVGLMGRSLRYALYAEDGEIKVLNQGDKPGECEISGGETMLGAL